MTPHNADIVVFTDDSKLQSHIVVETKEQDCTDNRFERAIEQGFGNANSLRSQLLIVDSFRNRSCFNIQDYPANERVENRVPDVPKNYGLIPVYKYSRGGDIDLATVSFGELSSAFKRCHNIIWSGGKLDPTTAFDEMSKILFAKIQDERNTPNNTDYQLQVGTHENEIIVSDRVRSRYEEAQANDRFVFNEDLKISDTKIFKVINVLEGISLTETDLDAKGQAFETFLGVLFRGELGQYFTRRQIVEFVVSVLKPTESDMIMDPSCGSGGFLLYCMKEVIRQIRRDYEGNQQLIDRKIFEFTRQMVYGIELNSQIARVAMMDMIVNEDGSSNIENNTGLNSVFTNPQIRFGNFSLIMTNPPFGVKVKSDDRDNLGANTFEDFDFGRGKTSQLSDILFLEQYRNLLSNDARRNPRAGIVLQTGVLNNPSNRDVLEWIRCNFEILGIVSLPVYAFRKAGSGMKTSLLFIRKYSRPFERSEDIPDYEVFFARANHIGYDSTLRPDENQFPDILEHFENRTEDRAQGIFWLNFHELDYRLDADYYHTKYIVEQHFDRLRELGHTLVPLSAVLNEFNSGKSPDGGVTRSTGEIPSITISNITSEGALDFNETLNFVSEDFYNAFNESKGELKYLDILIAKDGATTGKTAIIDDNFQFLEEEDGIKIPKAIFSEHVFRLSMRDGVNPLFVHAFLNSQLGQMQLEMITSGGAQGGITRDFVDQIFIPLVETEIQTEIADQWSAGMVRIEDFKRDYQNEILEVKASVETAVLEADPITQDKINEILGVD